MYNQFQNNSKKPEHCDKCKKHVHEILGSTAIFSECDECHNHRFATVSGEEIRMGDTHIHEIKFRTDFSDGHFHEFCGKSGPYDKVLFREPASYGPGLAAILSFIPVFPSWSAGSASSSDPRS